MTASAPSPTAEATRLADSARASPATNTPGMLVSRWYGIRSSSQPRGRSPPTDRSGPAITKPRESRTTTPSTQPVGQRRCPDKQEQQLGLYCFRVARRGVPQPEALQVILADRLDDL